MKKLSIMVALLTVLLAALSFEQGLREFYVEDYFSWFTPSVSETIASNEPEQEDEDGIERIVVTGSRMAEAPFVSPIVKFWVKFGFSVVFGFCALFVILSQKYNAETQKWAFSILSLVSGVWIGTVT